MSPRDQFINAAVVPNSYSDQEVPFRLSGGYVSATDHVSGYCVLHEETSPSTVRALRAGGLATKLIAMAEWSAAPWRMLNLDIEGLDEQVLHDLNLEPLRPDVLAVESFVLANISAWKN